MKPPRLSSGVLAVVILIHAGILALILFQPKSTHPVTPPAPLFVRLIEAATAPPERVVPPAPPRQAAPNLSVPPPVMAALPTPSRPAPETAQPARQPQPAEPIRQEVVRPEVSRPEPQPTPTPVLVPAPAPAAVEAPRPAPAPPIPVTQPRFNADYLDNPKPPYPSLSRRMGEEGEVRLRVHVDASGNTQQVEIARSSGYPRLDQAAQDTVRKWRFVPARQGDQPVAAWVIVPIQFSLRS